MPTPRLYSDTLTVTTAGTRVPFASYNIPVKWIRLQAKAGMTGALVVGCAQVVAAADGRKGVVVPEESADGANSVEPLLLEGPLDLSDLYLDSTVDAETVNYLAEPDSARMYGGIQETEFEHGGSSVGGTMRPGRVWTPVA